MDERRWPWQFRCALYVSAGCVGAWLHMWGL